MKDTLLSIEQTYSVKVLYACEAGSRAWGLASENSDYDVRFIYIHPLEWYLDIDQKRDVIEHPINHSLDLSGWDLRKALFLLRKSNPPLLEWLHSNLIYAEHDSFKVEIDALAAKAFSTKACMLHYLNMTKRNFKEIFQKDEVMVKKYFTVLRPLLACKWIEIYHTFPSMHFPLFVQDLVKDGGLKKEIKNLIQLKITKEEYISSKRTPLINKYIKDELLHFEEYVETLTHKKSNITNELNLFFRKMLKEN